MSTNKKILKKDIRALKSEYQLIERMIVKGSTLSLDAIKSLEYQRSLIKALRSLYAE
jgi:hypothetical protein